MKFAESITDFFKSPKWVTNLIFAGLCTLVASIPVVGIVGVIVLVGWLVTGFYMRQNDEDFVTFPDFDFGQLGKYLERGLWPVLTTGAVVIGVGLVLWLVFFIPVMILSALLSDSNGVVGGFFALILSLLSLVIYSAIFAVISLIIVPLSIRASLVQDFVKAFDINFIKKFALMMWKEILIASLFVAVVGAALSFIGFFAFCVGMFLAQALTAFAWTHLSKQIYKLYLSRGGEPVPVSPKLAVV
ncbi:DUF4013 domain-containing protein [Verrucomicrobium sp. BvORR106]|uniref:DUF4013 domain-containing protein n=1 Tax=Verrucomicrobium sp. BvORR106 TaxID=1403819 RepID=UPI00056F4913|nr:DUF4013 domain-containing protein [Verrucomicrobium sp. BvORR106]